MSVELELKSYLSGGGSSCVLHKMGGASDGSDSGPDPPASPRSRPQLNEDMEISGNGSSGSGNESHGNESVRSSSGNDKDSALLESSSSTKSSNSQTTSPPSSSNAYSLLSSEQDHPSTSGCSSEQSAKAKTQKELFKTLKKLKLHVPVEKRSKGRANTLNTLRYALRCVKQVKANEEYYQMLMINERQPPGVDVSSYTIEEMNSIMSEYTLKNTDIFAVAVSLITGKIVYISEQASTILHCRKDEFKDRKFVEFLTPQDVSVFYSYTTPYRLPAWSMCIGPESSAAEFVQEKSFFCRISGGKGTDGDLQYYPFRMTPYLMKVQDPEMFEEHFCCLLLAERVHSGYEAPRIPTDKRIFTTTHTPNCVFQDVDERAVPLLGYLPQDLIGTPVLSHLHPDDRPTMLAVHRKIMQYNGQPFDHSSIRFCTRNGEYVTLDTSWSSFVNPWSRKVSFVIGRHKVRMGPVNEDVFSAPVLTEGKTMDSDIQEITEQIHKILLQPIHSIGSSGYGSHGSNGSYDHLHSVPSSSEGSGNGTVAASNAGHEENGLTKPRSFQEICKGVQMLKTQDQQGSSPNADPKKSVEKLKSPGVKQKDAAPVARDGTVSMEELRDQTLYSYQQISCLDSVIRYLESYNTPTTSKRKYQFSSNTTSSNSDEEKKGCDGTTSSLRDPLKSNKKSPTGVVGGALTPLALPTKAESVMSQCSYSSTIVHVGDKKPQPESEIIEDLAESLTPLAPITVPTLPTPELGTYRKVDLTKQVLAVHTQKEEQAFLSRCRELSLTYLHKTCSSSVDRERGNAIDVAHAAKPGPSGAEPTHKKSGRTRKTKKPRIRKPESSDSSASQYGLLPPLQGLNQTSWSPSEASQSTFSVPYPTMVPGYTVYPNAVPPTGDCSSSGGFGDAANAQALPAVSQYPASMVTPTMAFVLPNYMFPQVDMLARPPFYSDQQQAYNAQQPFQHQQGMNAQQPIHNLQSPWQAFQTQQNCNSQQPLQQTYPAQQTFLPQHVFFAQNPFQTQTPVSPLQSLPMQTQFIPQAPVMYQTTSEPRLPVPEMADVPSSSPASQSPQLFASHCSSPLQLDLLYLEDKADSHSTAPPSGSRGNCGTVLEKSNSTVDVQQTCCLDDDAHSETLPSSSELMELLMQEDSGSASSASTGSASNGCNTYNSGTGSSKYFGSVDSSEHEHKEKRKEDEQNFKYVLQEPFWLLMAKTDDEVMMTYQMPSRDLDKVLREDRERLRRMQKSQLRFTSAQRREVVEQHPCMRRRGMPRAINVKECLYCKDDVATPLEDDLPDMELELVGTEAAQKEGMVCSQKPGSD